MQPLAASPLTPAFAGLGMAVNPHTASLARRLFKSMGNDESGEGRDLQCSAKTAAIHRFFLTVDSAISVAESCSSLCCDSEVLQSAPAGARFVGEIFASHYTVKTTPCSDWRVVRVQCSTRKRASRRLHDEPFIQVVLRQSFSRLCVHETWSRRCHAHGTNAGPPALVPSR
jgi:hypothetical protein